MIYLASASPRRQAILRQMGFSFTVTPSHIEETIVPGAAPDAAVSDLARRKAEALPVILRDDDVVLGADTVVTIDGIILGKPVNADAAAQMLRLLSGRTHEVYTGVFLKTRRESETFVCRAEVTFYPLTDADIAGYIATGEPMDKAGAYGIQGRGCMLTRSLSGDFYTVVGLPAGETARRLRRLGIRPAE